MYLRLEKLPSGDSLHTLVLDGLLTIYDSVMAEASKIN